jgi:hypothetical protein
VISPWAYKLELLNDIQIHPVQHVSYLDSADDDALAGQQISPHPTGLVDGKDEWFVDEILDSQIRSRRLEYLVKWTEYEEADWRLAKTLNEHKAVDNFHRRYPNKPGPLPESEQ